MAYYYWNGLSPLLLEWAQPTINEKVGDDRRGNSQHSNRSLNAVSALGESAVERYLVSSVSFKRIHRIDQFTRDSRQKWGSRRK